MKTPPKFSLREKALAVEMVVSGYTILETSRLIGSGKKAVSKWVSDYFGYKGSEGITITKQSKINEELQEAA